MTTCLDFGLVERAALLDFAIHQRRLEHAQRAQARGRLLAHRVRYRSLDVVNQSQLTLDELRIHRAAVPVAIAVAEPEPGCPGCGAGAGIIIPGTDTPQAWQTSGRPGTRRPADWRAPAAGT